MTTVNPRDFDQVCTCFCLGLVSSCVCSVEDISIAVSSGDIMTRLVVTKSDCGKIIGKGGQNIASLRQMTGAQIKAIDLSQAAEAALNPSFLEARLVRTPAPSRLLHWYSYCCF